MSEQLGGQQRKVRPTGGGKDADVAEDEVKKVDIGSTDAMQKALKEAADRAAKERQAQEKAARRRRSSCCCC